MSIESILHTTEESFYSGKLVACERNWLYGSCVESSWNGATGYFAFIHPWTTSTDAFLKHNLLFAKLHVYKKMQ